MTQKTDPEVEEREARHETASRNPFQAVLWDFDGTLVDTEPYWIKAEYRLVESYGAAWSHEDALQLVGNDLLDSGRYIIERTGIPLTPEQVVEALIDDVVVQLRGHIPWRNGARELLTSIRAEGIPCALVTMSYERFVAPVLDALPPDTFATIVTGEYVTRGKPHPDPYLEGAERLGLEPSSCVAIEDSVTGSTSALAAGCRTIVVPSHVAVDPSAGAVILEELPTTWHALCEAASHTHPRYGGERVNV